MKLSLGTAQFGLSYGIANSIGQVNLNEVKAILEYALVNGISSLDTAVAYGNSEMMLGDAGVDGWNVISKLPEMPTALSYGRLKTEVQASFRRLKLTEIHGILLHRPGQLLEPNGQKLYDLLQRLKQEGLVKKIGISIYDVQELAQYDSIGHFDIVQMPFNLLDKRPIEAGIFKKLSDQGTEIHVRSIFLQGVLLMTANQRPKKFDRWDSIWQTYDNWLIRENISRLEACLSYVMQTPFIDKIIVGVDSLKQLVDIVNVSTKSLLPPDELFTNDVMLLNPGNWNQL
jgi:aryl-alcohol dehydrogenase-like predicted oxidoreductase